MFSLYLNKYKYGILFIFTAVSLLWIMDTPAKGISSKAANTLPHVAIQNASQLVSDASESSDKQIPILMFFSMNHCPFCIEVEEDYLKPMLRNSEYDGKVIIRKIQIDSSESIHDFTGKERDEDEFSDDYNISMVPTLILVDSRGNKIVPAIIGITNSHYYSHDLDNAIDLSTQKIRTLAKR